MLPAWRAKPLLKFRRVTLRRLAATVALAVPISILLRVLRDAAHGLAANARGDNLVVEHGEADEVHFDVLKVRDGMKQVASFFALLGTDRGGREIHAVDANGADGLGTCGDSVDVQMRWTDLADRVVQSADGILGHERFITQLRGQTQPVLPMSLLSVEAINDRLGPFRSNDDDEQAVLFKKVVNDDGPIALREAHHGEA